MKNRLIVDRIVFFLLLVGGFSWGIIAVFNWNFISAIFGSLYIIPRIIYFLIGLAAVYRFVIWARAKAHKKKG